MDDYYKRCIEKKRLIYNFNLWDTIFSAFTPIFIILLLSLVFFSILFQNINTVNDKNNRVELLVSVFGILLMAVLIIVYYRNGKLAVYKGVTRSNNKKNINNFLKNKKFKIEQEENDMLIVYVKVWNEIHHTRKLTILFKEKLIYYNCTTYVTMSYGHGVLLEDFRPPFFWFSNRKIEKELRRFLDNNTINLK